MSFAQWLGGKKSFLLHSSSVSPSVWEILLKIHWDECNAEWQIHDGIQSSVSISQLSGDGLNAGVVLAGEMVIV